MNAALWQWVLAPSAGHQLKRDVQVPVLIALAVSLAVQWDEGALLVRIDPCSGGGGGARARMKQQQLSGPAVSFQTNPPCRHWLPADFMLGLSHPTAHPSAPRV
jgi:hypothetical protein